MERFEGIIESVERGGAYIPVPPETIEALGGGGRIPVRATFDALSFTNRREAVTSVSEAKQPETRARRITKIVDSLT